ncbi:hypothetical protein MLD38_013443 [Melastoma candidum]|uniref:Uncharacterized protein n=2 Tax=Melastoma candidum TaxID=119954 RepID=A0ACB9LMM5_9MYRT|nr:hypothetical protein MLD38_037004 [Melastoma candidum]KAI4375589.1 hypothetical protein MLD38_013443 [Melastoma candidum]
MGSSALRCQEGLIRRSSAVVLSSGSVAVEQGNWSRHQKGLGFSGCREDGASAIELEDVSAGRTSSRAKRPLLLGTGRWGTALLDWETSGRRYRHRQSFGNRVVSGTADDPKKRKLSKNEKFKLSKLRIEEGGHLGVLLLSPDFQDFEGDQRRHESWHLETSSLEEMTGWL